MRKSKTLLSQTALCAAFCSQLVFVPGATAQQAADAGAATVSELEMIVVTARKREESLQDVPLSISVLSGQDLERGGIESLEDVANFTPGLTFQEFNGGGLGTPVIRGLSQTDIASFDSNVGVFLDGVFISARANLDVSLFDLERVEVTRGPQSALYGNNSFSGAINYVTKKPTDELTARLTGTVGTDERYEIDGAISGPIVDGVLAGRLTAGYRTFDGTIDNALDDENLGGYDDRTMVSGTLEFTPIDSFSATLFGYFSDENLDGSAGFINTNNCGGPNSENSDTNTGRGGSIFRFFCGELEAAETVFVGPEAFSERTSRFGYFSFAWDVDFMTVKGTTSYGNYSADALSDQQLDATTLDPTVRRFLRPFIGDAEDVSQEIRLESYDVLPFDWVLGGYFISRSLEENFQTGTLAALQGLDGPLVLDRLQQLDSDAFAVFGMIGYSVTDRLNVSGEVRYTVDDQTFSSSQSFRGLPAVLDRQEETFRFITFRVTGDYAVTDDVLAYATIARGARSGGFNVSSDPSEASFDEETNLAYEGGVKTVWADGRINLNVAGFYIDWSDVQIPSPSSVPGNANVTQNIGDASAVGFEIDASWAVTENTTLRVGYAFSDATFDDGIEDVTASRRCATPADCFGETGPNGGVLVGGNQLPRSAKHQVAGSLTQYYPTDIGEFYFRTDVSYQSARFSTPLNLQDDGDRTLVNVRLGVELNEYVDIAVWSNNLFDKDYVNSSINEPEFVPSSTFSTGFISNGRTIGGTVSLRY